MAAGNTIRKLTATMLVALGLVDIQISEELLTLRLPYL